MLRGLGLHRSDRAADVLLKLIETGAAADARAAVKALAPRRFEPGLREKIVAHAARNARVDLNDTLAKALAD